MLEDSIGSMPFRTLERHFVTTHFEVTVSPLKLWWIHQLCSFKRIFRDQMDVLRNAESTCDSSKREGMWADIILATFQAAYALTSTLETGMCINNTLTTFFPLNFFICFKIRYEASRMARNLGCICGNLSNSFRHQFFFFKLSYQ